MERFNCTKCGEKGMRPQEARIHTCPKKYLPRIMVEVIPGAEEGENFVEMATSATPEGDRRDYLSLEESNDLVAQAKLETLWELVLLGRKADRMMLERHTADLWQFFKTVAEEHYFKLRKEHPEIEVRG